MTRETCLQTSVRKIIQMFFEKKKVLNADVNKKKNYKNVIKYMGA